MQRSVVTMTPNSSDAETADRSIVASVSTTVGSTEVSNLVKLEQTGLEVQRGQAGPT